MKLKHDIMNNEMFDTRDEDEQNINFNYNTMSELKIVGVVESIPKEETGITKSGKNEGKEWKKQSFVIDTNKDYNPLICFGVFGEENIAKLITPLKVGETIEVYFNLSSRKWEKDGKVSYFTSADAWRIEKVGATASTPAATEEDDLPF